MTRFERKWRKDVKLAINTPVVKHTITDLMDDYFKTLWRINDEEYDYIVEVATDAEMYSMVIGESSSISDMKMAIRLVNTMVDNFINRVREDRENKLNDLL
jgi:hypothetical protein